ncbi:dodecin [Sphingomonas sp.]|uniref:dodecin n=1 Tax=Sphingomonas sp. TaxID=28214 RepID=UPI003B009940
MSNYVAKIVEVVGTSDKSIDDAIEGAVARASETLRHIRWFEVTEMRGQVKEGKVERYQIILKLGFSLDEKANHD